MRLPIALFNGTVATTNGLYSIEDIGFKEAKQLVSKHGFESAIGHQATADILSELLQQDVQMNRIQFKQEVGQFAVVLKLNKRPPEGIILNKEEMEKIGFSLKLMKRIK
ncbi:YddF family protein [Proteinivorax hydrogeniformans]|uniref:YddF family protein n=1 Tax=Proteinivorax hydrogeniformans TaxID=1826727 RepID=A0AAU8HVN3_9FIRM